MTENNHLKQTPGGAQDRAETAAAPGRRDYVRVYYDALDGSVCDETAARFEADRERRFRCRAPNLRSFTELTIEYKHAGLKPVSNAQYIVGTYFALPVHHE